MGWASGSYIYNGVIHAINKHIDDKKLRIKLHKDIMEAFFDNDWDTDDECRWDESFDQARQELHPEWYQDD